MTKRNKQSLPPKDELSNDIPCVHEDDSSDINCEICEISKGNKYDVVKKDFHSKKVFNHDGGTEANTKEVCLIFRCMKRLFKKKRDRERPPSSTEDGNGNGLEQSSEKTATSKEVGGVSIDTFAAMLGKERNSLTSLIGREFTLTTSVSVQAVMEGDEPQVILQGSIPFEVPAPNGTRKRKKVHVVGKLYSSRGESADSTVNLPVLERSLQSWSYIDVDMGFKAASSSSVKVDWHFAECYTPQQYYKKFFGITLQNEQPLPNGAGDCCYESVVKYDGSDKVNRNLGRNKLIDTSAVPVKTITLTKVRMKRIKFNDGSQVSKKCGKEKITVRIPSGMFFKCGRIADALNGADYKIGDDSSRSSCESSSGSIKYRRRRRKRRRRKNRAICARSGFENDIKLGMAEPPLENAFTQDAFYCLRPNTCSTYNLDKDENIIKFLESIGRPMSLEEMKDKALMEMYPEYPMSYSPLTWIYKYYDKTKSFMRGFSINEIT